MQKKKAASLAGDAEDRFSMKWQAAGKFLSWTGRYLGSEGAPLGLLVDVGAFCAALEWMSLQRAQAASFLCALALAYWPRLTSRGAGAAQHFGVRLGLRVTVVALLAYCMRGGVFDLLVAGWGWPPQAGIVPAAIAAALVLGRGNRYAVSNARWEAGGAADWRVAAIGAAGFAVALRLIYAGRVELMPEEAYYWNYARHLDIGYLDHPPMVGWLIAAGTAVFGDAEFGVRIGALCCGAVAGLFTYRLTREMFGAAERAARPGRWGRPCRFFY